ncbi:accessory gene regulator ArgB-like protein [Fusibacter bizertensis]
MDYLVLRIVDRFIKKKIISEEDKEIYLFGLKQSAVMLMNFIIIFLIGLMSGELKKLTLFSITYLILRPYAGGYHSKTELGCLFASAMMIISVVMIIKVANLSIGVNIIALVISSGILVALAPVEDYRNALDESEVKIYRKKFRKLLSTVLIIIAIAMAFANDLVITFTLAVVMISFMVLLGWITKA